MNKDELVQRLNQLNVDPRSYSFDFHFPDECYVLTQGQDKVWWVYYAERGLRSGLKEFATEAEACAYFLDLLARDTTTRRKLL